MNFPVDPCIYIYIYIYISNRSVTPVEDRVMSMFWFNFSSIENDWVEIYLQDRKKIFLFSSIYCTSSLYILERKDFFKKSLDCLLFLWVNNQLLKKKFRRSPRAKSIYRFKLKRGSEKKKCRKLKKIESDVTLDEVWKNIWDITKEKNL